MAGGHRHQGGKRNQIKQQPMSGAEKHRQQRLSFHWCRHLSKDIYHTSPLCLKPLLCFWCRPKSVLKVWLWNDSNTCLQESLNEFKSGVENPTHTKHPLWSEITHTLPLYTYTLMWDHIITYTYRQVLLCLPRFFVYRWQRKPRGKFQNNQITSLTLQYIIC